LHDRDVNAARNLLLFAGAERRPPAAEIPSLQAGEDVKMETAIVPDRR
jgi:transposase